MVKRLDFALYRSTYVDRLLFLCRALDFDYLLHNTRCFDISQNRWVRIQKKRMLFLFVKTSRFSTRAKSLEGIRHIFVAARLQYGHKNKPNEV